MSGNSCGRPWSLGRCEVVSRVALNDGAASLVGPIYEHPDPVRAFALRLPHWSPGRGKYPGNFLFAPIPTEFFCSMFSSIVDTTVRPHREYRFAPFARIRDSEGKFQEKEDVPHFDGFCDYVGVISLSTLEDIRSGAISGTSFWRHARTGLTSVPADMSEEEATERFFAPASSSWEQVGFVAHQYNHMAVFPSRAFHRIEFSNAGASSTRLTQNLYVVATPRSKDA